MKIVFEILDIINRTKAISLKKKLAFEGIFKELKRRRYYESKKDEKRRKLEEKERRKIKKLHKSYIDKKNKLSSENINNEEENIIKILTAHPDMSIPSEENNSIKGNDHPSPTEVYNDEYYYDAITVMKWRLKKLKHHK